MEEGRIRPLQLGTLAVGFIFGSSVVLTPGRLAEQDAWFAILLGMAEGSAFMLVFALLSRRFPGRTYPEIAEAVFGKWLGKALAFLLVVYLLYLCSLVLGNYGDFLMIAMMAETPKEVLVACLAAICVFAVLQGVEVIARASEVLVPLAVAFFVAITLLAGPQIDLRNLRPILAAPPAKILWAAHAAAVFPFAETVAFMMVLPFLHRGDRRKGLPAMAAAFLTAGFIFTVVIIRNTGILGSLGKIVTYPSYEAAKLVDVGRAGLRLEVLIALNFLTMGFLKAAVLYYASVLGLAQILGLASYRPLVAPVGLFLVALSRLNFANLAQNVEMINVSYPVFAPLFEVLIPAATLILACLRGKAGEGQ
ncbi:MAG: GerAB/ArcD/ProY family transporter [Bacteroidota bacterium]